MQFLIFHLDKDSYAMPTAGIARVLPLMELKALPQAPSFVAGLMNLHGQTVPVVDLCRLACGRPHEARFDTRILLIDYAPHEGITHPLGLIAEKVEGIIPLEPEQLNETGVDNEGAPYLGRVATHGGRIVQLISAEHLLKDDVRSILFPDDGGPAA